MFACNCFDLLLFTPVERFPIILAFIRRVSERCFTDGNGPEVFKQCAKEWVSPDRISSKDDYGQYEDTDGHGRCSQETPPSALDELCKTFHEKIKELQ